MVRIQGRGVAGTVAAKVKHLFGLCKEFEEKVWKWRRFLTDVGCGRYKMLLNSPFPDLISESSLNIYSKVNMFEGLYLTLQ